MSHHKVGQPPPSLAFDPSVAARAHKSLSLVGPAGPVLDVLVGLEEDFGLWIAALRALLVSS